MDLVQYRHASATRRRHYNTQQHVVHWFCLPVILYHTIFDLFLFFYLVPFAISIGFFIGRRIICVPDCVRLFVSGIRRVPSRLYILFCFSSECVTTSWHLLSICIIVVRVRRLSITARSLLYRLSLTMYA
jgi:hypothetical protein